MLKEIEQFKCPTNKVPRIAHLRTRARHYC